MHNNDDQFLDNSDVREENILAEEIEKALKKEESTKKLKAILFVALPLVIAFLIFSYYFIRMIEANKIS